MTTRCTFHAKRSLVTFCVTNNTVEETVICKINPTQLDYFITTVTAKQKKI